MRMRSGLILLVLTLASSTALVAQTPADSAAEGREAGRKAAEQVLTMPYIMLGVASGATLGFQGAISSGHQRSDGTWRYAAMGGGALVGGAITIALMSEPDMPRNPAIGDSYANGFREGYGVRLRQRRRNAMLVGALVGVGTGFIFFQYARGIS